MEQNTKNKVIIITTKKNDLEWQQYNFQGIREHYVNYWNFIKDVPDYYLDLVLNIVKADVDKSRKHEKSFFEVKHSGKISNIYDLKKNINLLIEGYSDKEDFPMLIDILKFKSYKLNNGDCICIFPCLPDGKQQVGAQQYFLEFLIYAWTDSVLKDKELSKEFSKILEKYEFIFLMHEKDFTTDINYKQVLLKDEDFKKLEIKISPQLKPYVDKRYVKIVLYQHDGTHAPGIYGNFLSHLKKASIAPTNDKKLEKWIKNLNYFIDHNLLVNWKAFIIFRNKIIALQGILQNVISEYQKNYSNDIALIYTICDKIPKTRDLLFVKGTEGTVININPQIVSHKSEEIKTFFDTVLEESDVHNIF